MTEDEILQQVLAATGHQSSDVTVKTRQGRQIKANALWEGSSSPSSARVPLGLFFATNAANLAVDGAVQRLRLSVPYPEAVVALFGADSSRDAAVFGYGDSKIAAALADRLGVTLELVPRPTSGTDAKPASTLDIQPISAALSAVPNVILQGPPGTGKSTIAREYVRSLLQGNSDYTLEQCRFTNILQDADGGLAGLLADLNSPVYLAPVIWEMVQLHPGYGYDDLVRRIKPTSQDGDLHFIVEDRLLPQLCAISSARGDKPVVLVLDEVNRCNLSAVLGEFIFALDATHRGERVRLQYQGDGLQPSIAAPDNLFVIGTMNTADRSIAMVDYAVRRRFRFVDVPADVSVVANWYVADAAIQEVATEWFQLLNASLPENLLVGHSYFLLDLTPRATWPGRFARQLTYQVIPLLHEYSIEGIRSLDELNWRGDAFDPSDPLGFEKAVETAIAAKLS